MKDVREPVCLGQRSDHGMVFLRQGYCLHGRLSEPAVCCRRYGSGTSVVALRNSQCRRLGCAEGAHHTAPCHTIPSEPRRFAVLFGKMQS